jgi:anthranilate synthase/aminodeoxychorismate synthase-like glutamine amidotransferase
VYLLIDNYDSFTYNLYQVFVSEGVEMLVKRNDTISTEEITELSPEKIVISPGPGSPDTAGISVRTVKRFTGTVPILGICLGHQCISRAFGGNIERVSSPVHGRTSPVYHDSKGIFKGMSNPFPGARYHSLYTGGIPDCFEICARTEDGIVMGIRHRQHPLTGLQFHPESFLTENGTRLIKNFIEL